MLAAGSGAKPVLPGQTASPMAHGMAPNQPDTRFMSPTLTATALGRAAGREKVDGDAQADGNHGIQGGQWNLRQGRSKNELRKIIPSQRHPVRQIESQAKDALAPASPAAARHKPAIKSIRAEGTFLEEAKASTNAKPRNPMPMLSSPQSLWVSRTR